MTDRMTSPHPVLLLLGLAVAPACAKKQVTLQYHLQHSPDLPIDFGLVVPPSGALNLGHPLLDADGTTAGDALNKAPIKIAVDGCFYVPSAPSANEGKWSSTVKYDAADGFKTEFAYPQCANINLEAKDFQSATLSLTDVQVFEGLGPPIETNPCAPAWSGAAPESASWDLLVVDRVARAASITLEAKAGVLATGGAEVSCLPQGDAGIEGSMNRTAEGGFKGANLVLAARPRPIRLSRFATSLREVPGGITPVAGSILFGADGQTASGVPTFGETALPPFLTTLVITHLAFDPAKGLAGQVLVRISGMSVADAPSGAAAACVAEPGQAGVYKLDIGGSCGIYGKDGRTTMQLVVAKNQGAADIESHGLFKYSLSAYHWAYIEAAPVE